MPNVMVALSSIGGTLCKSSVIPFLVPHHEVWLTPAAPVPCINAANIAERKTWTQSEGRGEVRGRAQLLPGAREARAFRFQRVRAVRVEIALTITIAAIHRGS